MQLSQKKNKQYSAAYCVVSEVDWYLTSKAVGAAGAIEAGNSRIYRFEFQPS